MLHKSEKCFPILSAGGDLREERAALRGPGAAADRAELPRHRHPPRHEPGGEALPLPAVQGFPEGECEMIDALKTLN